MKVKVNIISTLCILTSDEATVPSLMMMTLIVSHESLARHRQTVDRQTDRQTTSEAQTDRRQTGRQTSEA